MCQKFLVQILKTFRELACPMTDFMPIYYKIKSMRGMSVVIVAIVRRFVS